MVQYKLKHPIFILVLCNYNNIFFDMEIAIETIDALYYIVRMIKYLKENSLHPYPENTEVCVFYLGKSRKLVENFI